MAKTDEIKADGGMASRKRAIARALIGRFERGRELPGAAKFLDLVWPGAAPMILEESVDNQPRSDRQRRDQENQGAQVEPEDGPPQPQRQDQTSGRAIASATVTYWTSR